MRPRSLSGLVLMASLALTMSAVGATKKSKKKAKRSARKALKAHSAGNYQIALGLFEEAYRYYPSPRLLFNIGQCHLSLENFDLAAKNFEQFLKEEPDSPNKEGVEKLLAEAKEEAAKKKQAEVAKTETTGPPEQADPAKEKKDAAETPAVPGVKPEPPKKPEPKLVEQKKPKPNAEESDPVYKKWWFWTIIGGVAVAGAGTAIAVGASGGETRTVLPSGSVGVLDRR